jgi:Na+/proline symporter
MSPHGEEADGVRLAAPGMTAGLAATDWVVLGGYFALVAWLALVVSRGKRTTSDYFLAGRTLPSWAVALSIIATETSAVTFIGVPRKAYDGDWTFLQLVFGFVLGRLFLAAFMVQVFFRHEVVTVYGYLEKRFGAGARTLAALLFLAGRVVASGVRLFAGCLALQAAAGLPDNALTLAVVILGGLGAVLATVGGVRAVVWTDVLLGLTFITAAGAAAVFLAAGLPGGVSGLLQSPELSAKLAVFDWSLKLDSPNTFLAGIAGGFFLTLATHGTDQDIAQRYLTCRDSRTGGRSVVGSAVLLLPLMALLLAVGTLLYFYYLGRPVPEPVE